MLCIYFLNMVNAPEKPLIGWLVRGQVGHFICFAGRMELNEMYCALEWSRLGQSFTFTVIADEFGN